MKKMRRRLASWLLCAAMVLAQCPQVVFAEGVQTVSEYEVGLCDHHRSHDAECGYTEGTPGKPCGHEHTEECFQVVTQCIHVHDEGCYDDGEDILDDATPSNAQERKAETSPHVCDADSGCVKELLDCPHEKGQHDEACGYAPAGKGTSCAYECQACEMERATPPNAKPGMTVETVQEMIDDLPSVEELEDMDAEELREVYDRLQAAYEAYEALTEKEKEEITGAEIFDSLFAWINKMVNRLAGEVVAGDFTLSSEVELVDGTDYTYEENVLTIMTGTPVTISMADGMTETSTDRIVIADGATANVTLDSVRIDVSNGSAFEVAGSAFCSLTLKGENTLKSRKDENAGLQVQGDAGIEINGPGKLKTEGGWYGAGIGGGLNGNGGKITINSGEVIAVGTGGGGLFSAGIGGGSGGAGGEITIKGGIIKASSCHGAGIGGGDSCDGGIITVEGGQVEAYTSGNGAGIGGGNEGCGGTITIEGGQVTVKMETSASNGGAGIGGGHRGDGGIIIISGGTVLAESTNGAGIGGGEWGGGGGDITITGGRVTARSKRGAGIGRGADGSDVSGQPGRFITGDGNAVIFADSFWGQSISDQDHSAEWKGVIFEGKSGKVYGIPGVTVDSNFEIPLGYQLEIPKDVTLTIPEEIAVHNLGTIWGDGEINGNVTGNPPKLSMVPKITSQPRDQIVYFKESATFTISASGNSDLTYQWQMRERENFAWVDLLGGYGASYTIPHAAMGMDGMEFRCVVRNTNGKVVSNIAKLRVEPAILSDTDVSLSLAEFIYDGTEKKPEVTVTKASDLVVGTDYVVTYPDDCIQAGVKTVRITGQGNYQGVVDVTYRIWQSSTRIESAAYLNGSPQIDFIYGATITVKAAIIPTGERPEISKVSRAASLDTPTGSQAALYVRKGSIDTQLTDPKTVGDDGNVEFAYATTEKGLDVGENTLIVKYMANDSMANGEAEIAVTLSEKSLTATAKEEQSKVYDGDCDFTDIQLMLEGLVEGDTVTATADGRAEDENVGQDKAFTAESISMGGADAGYYSLSVGDVSGTVEITKAVGAAITDPVTGSYVLDGNTFTYTVDPISGAEYSRDGRTWQNSNVFTGFTAEDFGTVFYARIKETANYEAGAPSDTGAVIFDRLPQAENPVLSYTVTGATGNKKIAIAPKEGCEYTFDGGSSWGEANEKIFSTDSIQTIGIRYKETKTHLASAGAMQEVSLVNQEQAAPEKFTLTFTDNGDHTFTATIPAVAGGEYSFDGQNWGSANTKADCKPNTAYTGYVRLAAKDGYNASPVTSDTQTTPRLVMTDPETKPNGGSSSGGSSYVGTTGPGAGNALPLPDYVVKGTWTMIADGIWTFTDDKGTTYKNTWAAVYNPYADVTKGQNAYDWFYFDEAGHMVTGWRKIDGKWYYFHEISDGTRGAMRTDAWIGGYYVDKDGVWKEEE